MARDLGCGLVRALLDMNTRRLCLMRSQRWWWESLRECAERSAELGVTIGVQNHHDIACDFESLYELIREVNCSQLPRHVRCLGSGASGCGSGICSRKDGGDHGVYNDSELCGAAPFFGIIPRW